MLFNLFFIDVDVYTEEAFIGINSVCSADSDWWSKGLLYMLTIFKVLLFFALFFLKKNILLLSDS